MNATQKEAIVTILDERQFTTLNKRRMRLLFLLAIAIVTTTYIAALAINARRISDLGVVMLLVPWLLVMVARLWGYGCPACGLMIRRITANHCTQCNIGFSPTAKIPWWYKETAPWIVKLE